MAQQYEFRLTWQTAEGRQARYTLRRGTNRLGRHEDNDCRLESTQVSRFHATIVCGEEECYIEDLGSGNGTYVDDELLSPKVARSLTRNAHIRFADVTVIFEQIPLFFDRLDAGTGLEPEAPTKPDVRAYPQIPGAFPYGFRMLNYLPDIYQPPANGGDGSTGISDVTFMARFLGIFESILLPIEWVIDDFDLFLYPDVAPVNFLPWLSGWFGVRFDSTWSEAQQRTFLREAHRIVARRGTRWALERVLEIYTGAKPTINEYVDKKQPFYFQVQVASKFRERQSLLEAIIDAYKPVNTTYKLEFV